MKTSWELWADQFWLWFRQNICSCWSHQLSDSSAEKRWDRERDSDVKETEDEADREERETKEEEDSQKDEEEC